MNDKKIADFQLGQIRTHHEAIAELPDGNVTGWIDRQAPSARFLLAHTFSGVVWGRREDDGRWLLSSDLAPTSPPLGVATLLHLRAFSESAELYLWRDSRGLHARLAADIETGTLTSYYDESQILWGSRGAPLDGNFTSVEDGDQGLVHAVPVAIPAEAFDEGQGHRPARLHLRHYIGRDKQTGLARISHSRLWHVDYQLPPAKEKNDGTA